MRRVCILAAERGVAVGAQVAYRDLAGFGRRRIDYDLDELRDDILYQIGALSAFGARPVRQAARRALQHRGGRRGAGVRGGGGGGPTTTASLPVLCQPGSVLARMAAAAGLTVVGEGFADRGYRADGTLVPRSAPGALVD